MPLNKLANAALAVIIVTPAAIASAEHDPPRFHGLSLAAPPSPGWSAAASGTALDYALAQDLAAMPEPKRMGDSQGAAPGVGAAQGPSDGGKRKAKGKNKGSGKGEKKGSGKGKKKGQGKGKTGGSGGHPGPQPPGDTAAVPTPGAAVAGLFGLGAVVLRRRRAS